MAIQKVQLTWDRRVNKFSMYSKTIKGVHLFRQNLAVFFIAIVY
ncbi:hypothetical protein EV13_0806 [Prochlorococcus sp. MIT 0702]|nr:hypothetical protein EV12_0996 [Prochlorococcus sp. MIT 0701]KGG29875.1 hypothetical protein EV13_0806 [Prochlorococcus sp. MIT 0702]KGG34444.1 hypothetical protein EV14_1199 [Prochlorococcus sp. MIT 0703]